MVGRLTFTEDGDAIDCSKMGVGGKAIPPNIDKASLRTLLPLPKPCVVVSCFRSLGLCLDSAPLHLDRKHTLNPKTY